MQQRLYSYHHCLFNTCIYKNFGYSNWFSLRRIYSYTDALKRHTFTRNIYVKYISRCRDDAYVYCVMLEYYIPVVCLQQQQSVFTNISKFYCWFVIEECTGTHSLL